MCEKGEYKKCEGILYACHDKCQIVGFFSSVEWAAARSFGTLDSKLFCFLAGIEEKKCLTAIHFYIIDNILFPNKQWDAFFWFIYNVVRTNHNSHSMCLE